MKFGRLRPSRRLQVAAWRARRPVVAALLLLVAALAYRDLTKPPPELISVLVTSTLVPAGSELSSAVTTSVRLPQDLIPVGAVTALTELESTTAAVTIPAGLPIVPHLLAQPVGGLQVAPGLVVAPVTLADQVFASLLNVGDRLTLFDQAGTVLAGRALVVRIHTASKSALVPTSSQVAVLVAVSEPEAIALAIAAGTVAAALTR